jgi:hypothetical protein
LFSHSPGRARYEDRLALKIDLHDFLSPAFFK